MDGKVSLGTAHLLGTDFPQVVEILVKHGAVLNPPYVELNTSNNEIPLIKSIASGHYETAEQLLRHGAPVNIQNARYPSALHYGINDLRAVQLLLKIWGKC